MTEDERQQIISEDYADFIIDYRYNPRLLEQYADETVHILNEFYAIVHIPVSTIKDEILKKNSYSNIPKVYGLTSMVSLQASGVYRTQNLPNFNLTGQGVLIGIVDTGIDYLNPVFLNESGTSKIVSIWDQTIASVDKFPFETYWGTEYGVEQINQALTSKTPLEIVPSMDFDGHGTMMAGVAAGTKNETVKFEGVSSGAELVVVKLKQAKEYLRETFLIPKDAVCFQENDIMWGVLYCIQKARQLNRPLALCLGLGTSQTSHSGLDHLSNFLDIMGDFTNVGIVTSLGNEGVLGRHFLGLVTREIRSIPVELNVSENDSNFSMVMWGDFTGFFSIDITSPNGEFIPRIGGGLQGERRLTFVFDETVLTLNYQIVESLTGYQLILFRFQNVSAGVWKFNVYAQGDVASQFHIWLPMGTFITENTYFINPNIYTTLLSPGDASIPITVTAYNPLNEALYPNASRGYTTDNRIKPELAAPGVNYIAPTLNNEFIPYTGTGVAASHTAGIVALFLEWAVVRKKDISVDTIVIKNYMIRGAVRKGNITYPNRDWGYGILSIYNVFDIFRGM